MRSVNVVVVGGGVVGFSTAVCVAEALPFCSVTLVAERFTPDTTSDGAAGLLFAAPFPDIALERQRRWFQDGLDHLMAVAASRDSPDAGVMLSSGWQVFKEVPEERTPFFADLLPSFRLMTGKELEQFPGHKFGHAFSTIKCECSTYLLWLEKRLKNAGGRVQQRKVNTLEELSGYDIIINCSGLGARTLVGDTGVYPVRGQVLKLEAPWLKHFIRAGDGMTYIYPGIHHVTVGGTRQQDDWRLEVDEGDARRILERCRQLVPSIGKAKVLGQWVGLRPSRRNPRVEREVVQLGGRPVPVVHNYGHGGWGVTLAWGTALDALGLVRQVLQERPLQAKL
ncbi:D-aspartate oxidase [Neosynchiropus ocellatus]